MEAMARLEKLFSRRSRLIVCGLAVFLGLGVFVFLDLDSPEPSKLVVRGPLVIEARGQNRSWRFAYVGEDGRLGTDDDVISIGDLVVPVDMEVTLQLKSDDYIYVFSCPSLELKEISVPDLEFSLGLRLDEVGNHDLAMDPMCGFRLPPGETMGTMKIVDGEDFAAWLRAR